MNSTPPSHWETTSGQPSGRQRKLEPSGDLDQGSLQLILDHTPVIVFATDAQGLFTLSQGQGLQALGLAPGQVVGQSVFDVYAGEPALLAQLQRALQGEGFETLVEAAGRSYQTHFRPMLDPGGTVRGLSGVSVDVTLQVQAQRRAQTLLDLSELMDEERDTATVEQNLTGALEILSRSMPLDFLVFWEQRGELYECLAVHGLLPELAQAQLRQGVSAQYFRSLGVLDGQAVFWDAHQIPPEVAQLQISSLALLPMTVPGQGTPLLLGAYRSGATADLWTPGERELLVAAARSLAVSRSRQLWVAGLDAAAHVDALTGLGNRRAFRRDLAQTTRQGHAVGVMSIDIDGLKELNDRFGHDQGDVLLRTFAHALQGTLRNTDRLYRLGGDEFVALLPGLSSALPGLLQRLERAVQTTRDAGFPRVSASSGVAVYPAEAACTESLLRLADERMYANKHQTAAQRHAAGRRVLVVEDQPGMGRLIEMTLRNAGYEVELVTSADAARVRLQDRDADLLVADLALPEGPQAGVALMRSARADGHSLPVLFLSANADPQVRVSGLLDGGNDFMVKPFERAELVARVGALLRRR